jgi:hypothetical protein
LVDAFQHHKKRNHVELLEVLKNTRCDNSGKGTLGPAKVGSFFLGHYAGKRRYLRKRLDVASGAE